MTERVQTSRNHALRYILLCFLVIICPIVALDYYTGYLIPAVAGSILALVLLLNLWQLQRGKNSFLSPPTVVGLALCLVVLSALRGQSYSVFWLYPLWVTLPILLSKRWSVWLGTTSLLVMPPVIFSQFETLTALVICVSMILSWLVSVWLMYAVTEQARRLKNMAVTDPLTGVYNRRYLELQAGEALEMWRRYERPTTLLLIDIDYFKRVNDKFGHRVGDTALKGLVALISERVRGADTVCRFGGEEFVVLLRETDIDDGLKLAETLRQQVQDAKILPEGSMTISIGASDAANSADLDHWLNLADTALYLAKNKGRNRVECLRGDIAKPEQSVRYMQAWR